MKNRNLFGVFMIAIMSIVISFTGCKKDENVVKTLTATPPTQTVSKDAGNFAITVTSNTEWTASSSAGWCTVAPASGSQNGTVTVTYEANSATSSRTATITITGTDVNPVSITVTQDKGSEPLPNQTNTEKLCDNGPWKVSAMTCDPAYNWPNEMTSDGQTDWYTYYMMTCEKDNIIQFSSNGNYVWEEGSDDCGQSGSSELWEEFVAQSVNGNWNFNIAETQITIDEYDYEIISLSSTEFKYKYATTASGTNLTITITLSH